MAHSIEGEGGAWLPERKPRTWKTHIERVTDKNREEIEDRKAKLLPVVEATDFLRTEQLSGEDRERMRRLSEATLLRYAREGKAWKELGPDEKVDLREAEISILALKGFDAVQAMRDIGGLNAQDTAAVQHFGTLANRFVQNNDIPDKFKEWLSAVAGRIQDKYPIVVPKTTQGATGGFVPAEAPPVDEAAHLARQEDLAYEAIVSEGKDDTTPLWQVTVERERPDNPEIAARLSSLTKVIEEPFFSEMVGDPRTAEERQGVRDFIRMARTNRFFVKGVQKSWEDLSPMDKLAARRYEISLFEIDRREAEEVLQAQEGRVGVEDQQNLQRFSEAAYAYSQSTDIPSSFKERLRHTTDKIPKITFTKYQEGKTQPPPVRRSREEGA